MQRVVLHTGMSDCPRFFFLLTATHRAFMLSSKNDGNRTRGAREIGYLDVFEIEIGLSLICGY
jgi:hypothetical protein